MESMTGGNCSTYMYTPQSVDGKHGYTIEFAVRKWKIQRKARYTNI